MSSTAVYSIDWVATFLHELPHVNFSFQLTNSTFDPDNPSYRESIVFLAALPVVWCVLVLLLTCICLCVHCCKEKPKKKKGTTCLRLITAVFIIFSIGGLAVGFFGNEEGNKGIQSTVEALQDTNDTLTNSVNTLSILDELADSITQKGLSTLRDVFNKHLVNVTLRKEVLGLADQIQNESGLVRKDIKSIKDKISGVSLDRVIQVTEDGEFYRWLGTIILLCWQIVVLLIYIIGTLKKSKCWLVWGIINGYVALFLVWLAAGIYLGGDVTASDFCVDPNTYVSSKVDTNYPEVIESFLNCSSTQDSTSFEKQYLDATQAIADANAALTLAANKTTIIARFVTGPVKYIRQELQYATGNLTLLSNLVHCGSIHGNYVKALHGVCNRALVGVALILLVLPVMGVSLIIVQCLAPRIWLLLGRKKEYRMVDDSDPFLPRPPPYNGYGAMSREERASVHERSFLDDSSTVVMSDTPRPASMVDESPPPAYDQVGSFLNEQNDMSSFPTSRPIVDHYAASNITTNV